MIMSSVYATPAITCILERNSLHSIDQYLFQQTKGMYPAFQKTERRDEDREAWKRSHPELPVPEQNRKPPSELLQGNRDDFGPRPDVMSKASREQLPPLSSIFNSERPSMVSSSTCPDRMAAYGPVSPGESLRSAPQSHQEKRDWETGYPPRPHSQPSSNQYSQFPRSGQQGQPELPPPPRRSTQDSRKPDSPSYYDSRPGAHDTSRGQALAPPVGWSSRSEAPYREYFPPVRDTLRIEHHPTIPSQPSRAEPEIRHAYAETSQTTPSTPHYPPTPSSTVSSDPIPTKDVLGPKIWTGTQFLPRFVRQAEVPGDGLCYFYDDGTHCKTHIDGEAVNAHWGVTKAGKPRKRLAIACITCREKKIKCDPDYPRCIQCEKFGRVCKFKNAPRGGHGSPETPPADADDCETRSISQHSDLDLYKIEKRDSIQSLQTSSPGRKPSTGSEIDDHPLKRQRTDYRAFNPVKTEKHDPYQQSSRNRSPPQASPPVQWASVPKFRSNPLLDTELINELLPLFFAHTSASAYCIFPEQLLRLWVLDQSIEKSSDDNMLIYSILAYASIFSSRADIVARGVEFATTSQEHSFSSRATLQYVQSRLLLSLFYEGINRLDDSWEFGGIAIRAALGMKLHVDIERNGQKAPEIFGMSSSASAECRRRTFWACFLHDRIDFSTGRPSIIDTRDIVLRLPSHAMSYEAEFDISSPYFEHANFGEAIFPSISPLGCLIQITAIYGSIVTNIARQSLSCPKYTTAIPSSTFVKTITSQLSKFHSNIPLFLKYNPLSLDNIVNYDPSHIGTCIMINTLYNLSLMRLHRHIQPDSLPAADLHNSIRSAVVAAEAQLRLCEHLSTLPKNLGAQAARTTLAEALLCAADIVTGRPRLTDVPRLCGVLGKMANLLEAAPHKSVRLAKNQLLGRCEVLRRIADAETSTEGFVDHDMKMVVMREPLEKFFGGPDLAYSAGTELFAKALDL